MERTSPSAPAPRCLLQVHAHPDDEASKGGGTNARYHAEGVRCVLVTCTGGEAGEVLNPAIDTPETRANLAAIRAEELRESAEILGYDEVYLLGYHDSGMPDTEVNARPDNFANAPLAEATERLVRIIRAERPQVIIAYDEDREWYPHPDHLRVHEVSVAAFDAAGSADAFPDAGPPWQPLKLYFCGWSRRRVVALHDAHLELSLESPYARWLEHPNWASDAPDSVFSDDRWTTHIDVSDYLSHRRAALLAHRTQVDPEGFWMTLSDETIRAAFPYEEYRLARTLVDTEIPEDDLFAGIP